MTSARRGLLVIALLLAMAGPAALVGAPGAQAQEQTDGGGVPLTRSGAPGGPFAGLEVTVSQTANLVNQAVRVTWTGGAPTEGFVRPSSPVLGNVLQIMQCWGDDPAGPDRTQCQFGAGFAFTIGSRRVLAVGGPNDGLVDPAETLTSVDARGATYVPFWPVGGERPAGGIDSTAIFTNPFLDQQVTNEVPAAVTRPDGTGEIDIEVQTLRQSSGLGCGAPQEAAGIVTGRSCWLVVVPRGTTEVDGSTPGVGGLTSSALAQTNWDQRIVFPLGFLPVGQTCPQGVAEQRINGNELALDAVSSWQPALCATGNFSYTLLTDDIARDQLLGAVEPTVSATTGPVPPDQAPADRPIVYAPITLSGLAIAFNIVRNADDLLPPDDPLRVGDGSPFTSMNLNQRLVAKLLTQSYRGNLILPTVDLRGDPPPPIPATNPIGLTVDPEFLALNREYAGRLPVNLGIDVLVQGGTSDVTAQLWRWVLADADARAFLAGTPDPDGMVVNPTNQNPSATLASYPRNDESCLLVEPGPGQPRTPYCTSDRQAVTNDMHDSARLAGRGDPSVRLPQKSGTPPTTFDRLPRQLPGEQAVLAVVDTATADRFGLPTASLRNASGQFVAPDTAGVAAGMAAMADGPVRGVRQLDPAAATGAAYPLTALTHAAVVPSALTPESRTTWAEFLRFAAGPGQVPGRDPGRLPPGYVPLPDELRRQTLAAADTIEASTGATSESIAGGGPAPSGGATARTGGTGIGSTTGTAGATGTAGGAGAAAGAVSAAGSAAAAAAGAAPAGPAVPVEQVAATRPTPALPAPAVGSLLVALLVAGGLAAVSAPMAHVLSRRGPPAPESARPRRVLAWPTRLQVR